MHHARYHNQVIFAEFTIVSHLKEIYKMEIRPKCLTLIILVLLFTFHFQTGKRVGELLNKSLMDSLLEEERQGSKKKPVGFLK